MIAGLSIAFGWIAAGILFWFLIADPPLTQAIKLALFAGLGLLPIAAAMGANAHGFEYMKSRDFCGSCHVMEPFTDDAADRKSNSLVAVHSRNAAFGRDSCYACHADYGMYGTMTTKLAGGRHAWHYFTEFYRYSLADAMPRIRYRGPFSNATCMRCHSTTAPGWRAVPDHSALGAELVGYDVSCVSGGCHGPPHPFSQSARDREEGAHR